MIDSEDKEQQIKQDIQELMNNYKQVNKLIIKSLIINLLIIILESWCIYNLFIIKHNGYKYLSKSICLICLIFATIVGLRSFQYILINIKHLFDIFVIRYFMKKLLK